MSVSRDPDAFFEPKLRFGIRKPANWRFMPPAWTPVAQLKNRSAPDDWIQFAKLPFVSMLGTHDSSDHVYPTVNVSCRPAWTTPDFDYERHLERSIEFLRNEHEDLQLLESSANAEVDGRRALRIRHQYTLYAERDGSVLELPVLARSFTIFGNGVVYSLGMSSSADEQFFLEGDFDLVLASVRIGVGLS